MMGGGFFPGFGMILFWGVLILLLVFLFRTLAGGEGKTGSKSAREVLEERYARGEIDKEEFLARKQTLE